ncbi:MAG TPA: cbb3-type cytochrome oxidase assembly protein CcoS, partial [Cyclobacteriaceae bacterium]
AVAFLFAFLWSLKSGQYDDTYSPSVRMLFDNSPERKKKKEKNAEKLKPGTND